MIILAEEPGSQRSLAASSFTKQNTGVAHEHCGNIADTDALPPSPPMETGSTSLPGFTLKFATRNMRYGHRDKKYGPKRAIL